MRQPNRIYYLLSVLVLLSVACNIGGRATPEPATVAPLPKTEEMQALQPTKRPTLEPTSEPTTEPTSEPTSEPPAAQPSSTAVPKNKASTIEVTNASGVDIAYIYIATTEAQSWGEDWLKGVVLADGDTYQFTNVPDGIYDMQASDMDDLVVQELWGIEVKASFAWMIERDVSLDIYNMSTRTISEVYISPAGEDTWGDDWLMGDEIPVDGSYYFTGMDAGSYDIKVADDGGKAIETLYNLDIYGATYRDIAGTTLLPVNAVLRFEDDFSDNRNNWGLGTSDNVIYQPPTNGEFCLKITTNNWMGWEWYTPFRPDEFVAEVECKPDSGMDVSCGLGFGPDTDNLYWFEVAPEYQTYALFYKIDGEWQDDLISWTESKNIDPSGWNYMSLERVNGIVSVFINAVLVGEVSSDHFPTGRIGIGGSAYSDSNVNICLDNLSVWRME